MAASPNLLNLARMSSTTTGTGTVTCAGAVAGLLTFALAGGVDGKTYTYAIIDNAGASEIGRGVLGGSGTTLTRTSILKSTNSNAALNLSGSQEVFITAAAEDIGVPSSTVVFTLKTTAPDGWLLFADQTMGDGSSGATFASVDAQAVFTDLFNNVSDANCPILTSAGGATTRAGQTDAATAWAAHCRMTMPRALGRALAVAGAGSGLTSRAVGAFEGTESETLTTAQIPGHPHPDQTSGSGVAGAAGNAPLASDNASLGAHNTGNNTGGGGSHNNMQPTLHLNAMVKL